MSTSNETGRHPVNVGHLVMGLAFLGLVAVWAVVQGDVIDNDDVRWLLPVPWVLAGAAGLAASVLSGRRHVQHQVGWVPPTAPVDELPVDELPVDELPVDATTPLRQPPASPDPDDR